MGCGSSTDADPNNNEKGNKKGSQIQVKRKGGNEAELSAEPDIEDVDVPKTEPGYPQPSIPKLKKDDVLTAKVKRNVDDRARETPDEKADTFEGLIAYLIQGLHTDVEKARSIFMWMGNQDIDNGDYKNVTSSETPRGFMKLIKDRRACYSSFFAVLCRKAGLPCVVIVGVAKSAAYEVGDDESEVKLLRNNWNAVYCDGSWRFVFPLWACSAVSGYSSGLYTKVETKGQATREKEEKNAGVHIKILNEFYFFTDPEVLIHMAFPDQSKWQLLDRPWDFSKFVSIPFCEQSYFKNEIEVIGKFNGRLVTKHGETMVEVTSKSPQGLSMDYELYYNNKESKREISSTLQLNNFVLLDRSLTSWKFCIRFPEEGVYKFQIVGGRYSEFDLVSFKVICDEAMEDCKPLPFNPGNVGYGPSLDTERAGIIAKTHRSGVVKMSVRKYVNFNFSLTKNIQMKTRLVHPTIPEEQLTQYCKQTRKQRHVNVEVCVPEEGEFALKIDAQQENGSEFENVCNYLLTSQVGGKKKKKREWENPVEKRTREDVKLYTKSPGTEDIEELEKSIDKFVELGMEDKGDLTAANDALVYKKDRKMLEDAIKRRHEKTLDKAIEHGHASKFKPKLTKQLDEAEDVRDHLKHLSVIAHDILEMKQETISELRSYKSPQPIIYDIMRSTFLMLGHERRDLEEWEDLQVYMGKLGKDSLIRKVRMFDTVHVEPDTKYRVKRMLEKHSEYDARKASAGAGTFYVWLRNVCEAIDQQQGQPQTPDNQS